jgi:RNA polymerase sigma-70 factor, ECF subfamily
MTIPFDPPTLEDVFRKYRDFVYRICFRYFRNPNDAEDVTQDVFLKIHRRLPEFRGESALTTWIYRIAANCCIDVLRAHKVHASLDDTDLSSVVSANIGSHGSSSLARIDLGRILENIDSRTREILFLTLAEGCGHEEVGEIVGLTKSAVSKIVVRFQNKMQTQKKAWLVELFHVKAKPNLQSLKHDLPLVAQKERV